MDRKDPKNFDATTPKNEPVTSGTAFRRMDIAYRMTREPPAGCVVCPETDGSYTVLDAAGDVEVKVSFALYDPSAPYVFYIDRQGVARAENFEDVRKCICGAVNRKLKKRQANPLAEASINRVVRRYENGVPMAIVLTPLENKSCHLSIKQFLDNSARIFGFGYHHIRGASADCEIGYILYGKPDKASEQLLKQIAVTVGKKYGLEAVGFSNVDGNIYCIHTACNPDGIYFCHTQTPYITHSDTGTVAYGDDGITAYAWNDIKTGFIGCYAYLRKSDISDAACFHISESYDPMEKFQSTSGKLRRKMAFQAYCARCWDARSQTYRFDHRYDRFFEPASPKL